MCQQDAEHAQSSVASVAPVRAGNANVGGVALRMWRGLFVVCAAAYFIATHIPRLAIGDPNHPIDKFAHAASAMVLMTLAWQTRWGSRLWPWIAVACAWFAVDELTQAIPGINRHAGFDDWTADMLGVLMSCMVIAAGRPVPGIVAGLLQRRRRLLSRMLMDRPMNWMHLATAAVLGAAVGAGIGLAADSLYPKRISEPLQAMALGGVFGALGGFYLMRELGLRALECAVAARSPCLECGAGDQQSSIGRTCAACGAQRHPLAWEQFAVLSGSRELRICGPVVLQGVLLFIAVAGGLIVVATWLGDKVEWVRSLSTYYNAGLAKDLRRVIDVAALCAVASWTYYRCRVRTARALDQSGTKCLSCGFDLQGSRGGGATGICAECGATFVRTVSPQAASAPR